MPSFSFEYASKLSRRVHRQQRLCIWRIRRLSCFSEPRRLSYIGHAIVVIIRGSDLPLRGRMYVRWGGQTRVTPRSWKKETGVLPSIAPFSATNQPGQERDCLGRVEEVEKRAIWDWCGTNNR